MRAFLGDVPTEEEFELLLVDGALDTETLQDVDDVIEGDVPLSVEVKRIEKVFG